MRGGWPSGIICCGRGKEEGLRRGEIGGGRGGERRGKEGKQVGKGRKGMKEVRWMGWVCFFEDHELVGLSPVCPQICFV